jgi:hypothetical protein
MKVIQTRGPSVFLIYFCFCDLSFGGCVLLTQILLTDGLIFFIKTIAAINDAYPSTPIVKRLHILHDVPEAQIFLAKWKELLQAEADIQASISTVSQEFHETSTRNAFTRLSTQINDLQKLSSNMHQVLFRRTEVFSPSKCIKTSHPSQLPISTPGAGPSSSPMQLESLANGNNGSSQPSSVSSVVSFIPPTTPPRPSYEPSLAPNPTPSPTSSLLQPHVNGGPKMIPVAIQKTGKIYYVLRLTPPDLSDCHQSLQILHDPILPPPTAFRDSEFPSFYNSTWQHIFERVVNPVALWEVYAPKNLGDYNNMGDLWQAWDEGSFVEGVGRLPALRLIEARWGTLKNQETNKGKYAAWRPHKNDRVSVFLACKHPIKYLTWPQGSKDLG